MEHVPDERRLRREISRGKSDKWGHLEYRFLRVTCDAYRYEMLVAFTRKHHSICPPTTQIRRLFCLSLQVPFPMSVPPVPRSERAVAPGHMAAGAHALNVSQCHPVRQVHPRRAGMNVVERFRTVLRLFGRVHDQHGARIIVTCTLDRKNATAPEAGWSGWPCL